MLGKLPVPGRLTIWLTVGQGPTVLAVGAGGGCLDIFTLICPFSPLSPSLWETARYRLKYCLKGSLNPRQPTNQTIIHFMLDTPLFRFVQSVKPIIQSYNPPYFFSRLKLIRLKTPNVTTRRHILPYSVR